MTYHFVNKVLTTFCAICGLFYNLTNVFKSNRKENHSICGKLCGNAQESQSYCKNIVKKKNYWWKLHAHTLNCWVYIRFETQQHNRQICPHLLNKFTMSEIHVIMFCRLGFWCWIIIPALFRQMFFLSTSVR